MAEGDSGLRLNLNSGPSAETSLVTGKPKTVLEHNAERAGDDDRQGNHQAKGGHNHGGGGSGKPPDPDRGEYISSLFNHNPEIPNIEQGEVTPAKEEVFSVRTFDQLNLSPRLVKNLSELGISTLTTIQSKALPIIMAGKDALVKSQTGSGKTLTYAIPILQSLGGREPRIDRKSGCFAIVIVPTRELAVQSYEWFQKLCKAFIWVVPCLLTGGENRNSEKARVRKGVNVLISTPGRMVDHMEKTENFRLDCVEWVVLDEADRMLELGYEREVRKLLTALQEKNTRRRQSVLLSATLTTSIQQLSEISLRHPVFVDAAESEAAGPGGAELVTPANLNQTFLLVPAKLRLVALGAFVLWKCQQSTRKKMLVFFPTQDMVNFYTKFLEIVLWGTSGQEGAEVPEAEGLEGLPEEARQLLEPEKTEKPAGLGLGIRLLQLHGSMKQTDRLRVFQEFRAASSGVLLCTDVAARGLDLPAVDWIVQYTAPTCVSDYVHRVGRTARIGAKGSSVIFLLPSEAGFVKSLEAVKIPLAEMTLGQVLQKLLRSGVPGLDGRPALSLEEAATNLQMRVETAVVDSKALHELACQAYVSYVRSYASYPREARKVFCFKDLHLGHCAKGFALRDPPSKITGIGKGQWVEKQERRTKDIKREEKIIKSQKRRIDQKSLIMSEFSTGFDGITKQDKEMKKEARKIKKLKTKM
jgi:ATP-dependent RNA helicase DDX31/DBP7